MDALRCIDESTIEDDQTSDVDQNDKSAPLSHSALSGAAEDSSRLSSGGAETFVDERSHRSGVVARGIEVCNSTSEVYWKAIVV